MTIPIKYLPAGKAGLLLLALCCFHFSLPAQQTTIDSLQNILSAAKEDTNKVNTLNNLAWEFINAGEYEKSLNCANQASILADKINYKKGKAKSYHNIGNIYTYQGNYPQALKTHFASLKIREEIGDKNGIEIGRAHV